MNLGNGNKNDAKLFFSKNNFAKNVILFFHNNSECDNIEKKNTHEGNKLKSLEMPHPFECVPNFHVGCLPHFQEAMSPPPRVA